ncbi:acyl-CoA dehydrogenase [Nocardioides marmoriginsengisoli]|uniref:Acyl-CoA dehydrogenase n=1 Tax=Nocardioides marmoriginsengisoli TaxID=661483 RepID=A0A3N0CR45_9ACTN|nr:acyl-CoA dehydrogenase family protein [Nocardioides marmoriginsengisoli]RNL65383.1 acyl-CoA dehydrogenase [Nocardioides marmoriginsengisoli]
MTTDAELTTRFAPVFARIAEGALDREADRRLPFEEVEWLREAGFGKIRVPTSHGGLGATLPQFFRQLIELGRADSNLPQLLRGHFGFVETRLFATDADVRDRWLHRLSSGVLVGNAQSEQGNPSFWENATSISRSGDGWRLSGRKFYSTGSLFADWIHTTASLDAEHSATVLVPASAAGVSRFDDWDGFGQRLTGSGTTVFDDVEIHLDDVEVYANGDLPGTHLFAFFQLVHLATLSGIGLRAVDDAVAFVRGRTRNLANPAYPEPKDDPQVQHVVGGISAASFAAVATTLAAVDAVEALVRGTGSQDDAELATFSAQAQVIDLVLGLTSDLFEVGGSSAVTERFRLDRHWRNARTLASHNPAIYRTRIVGDHALNGTSPRAEIQRSWLDVQRRRP